MQKKIKVLGIAPYEEMKLMMLDLVKQFPEIELKVYIGDLDEGLEIAKRTFNGQYDVIISRGATANLIKAEGMPVIEVEISSFDILCALKLANNLEGKTAIVSYTDIASTATQIKRLLGFETDIYPVDSRESIHKIFTKIKNKQYSAILCDMISDTIARQEGINSFLITSGEKSITRAFRQAVLLCHNHPIIHNENQLLRRLIFDSLSYVAVYNKYGQCILSTNNTDLKLRQFFENQIKESDCFEDAKISIKQFDNLSYTIKSEYMEIEGTEYYVFFYTIKKTPITNNRGIKYYSVKDAEKKFNDSVLSYTEILNTINKKIDQINKTDLPVIIFGEDGTGKEAASNLLYIKSKHNTHPLISIDCRDLDTKSISNLLDNDTSPLTLRKYTIYFSNIDVLNKANSQELLSTLIDMDVCKRNRVIFSCVCAPDNKLSKQGEIFANELGCTCLYLPSIRESQISMKKLVMQFISHRNITSTPTILEIEDNALTLLENFSWPHNLSQFSRVMSQIEILTNDQIIKADTVKSVLDNERHTISVNTQAEDNSYPIDLNRTLDKINKEIILHVLNDNNGNQSTTAAQLGIGRTTLWRYLKE